MLLTPGVSSAICVQKLDGSRKSAIHTTYRTSLRSSSLREPRYPLLRVVFSCGATDNARLLFASDVNWNVWAKPLTTPGDWPDEVSH